MLLKTKHDKIMKIEKSKARNKKYTAFVYNINSKRTRKIHFGDTRYQQYKDTTPLKYYSYKNHFEKKRKSNYFNRHSGTKSKREAIRKELIKSN